MLAFLFHLFKSAYNQSSYKILEINFEFRLDYQMRVTKNPPHQMPLSQLDFGSNLSKDIKMPISNKSQGLSNLNPASLSSLSSIQNETTKKNRAKLEWTASEDAIMFEYYIKEGSKWSQISKHIPNKTQNSIKNRFYCSIRKVQKKINIIQKKNKINQRKLVGLESLLTLLEIGKNYQSYPDGRFKEINQNVEEIIQMREEIIKEAMKSENDIDERQIEEMLLKILRLKHSLKFINVRRVKQSSQKSSQEVSKRYTMSSTYSSENQSSPVQEVQEFERIEEEVVNQIQYEGKQEIQSLLYQHFQVFNNWNRREDQCFQELLKIQVDHVGGIEFF